MQTGHGRHILIVEDDRAIRQDVAQGLEQQGYTVSHAEYGRQALDLIKHHLPDLAIVDLYLPDMNGSEVCRILKRYADIPIIVLTFENVEETKVVALDQYAEDYITKPYSRRELVARVGRILRRFNSTVEESYPEMVIDTHLRINFSRHWVEVPDPRSPGGTYERILLTPTESRILYLLIRNAPRVLTTDTLLSRVWMGDTNAYPEVLRVHIRRLRMKVEANPAQPRYVITQRGVGYRLGVVPQGALLPEAEEA